MPITIRAMFVGQGASLLPEDRFVNVFHFHSAVGTASPTDFDNIAALVVDFYALPISGGNALSNHMSVYVSRSAQVILYDLTTAEPRVPMPYPFTMLGAVGGGAPEEVAVCLSLQGVPPVTPRRRGRLYFGPLSQSSSTIQPAGTSDPARPAETTAGFLVPTLLAAADALMIGAQAEGVPWCIRSVTPTENFVPIVGGYVDNAFDTQRRRGPDPSARVTF